MKFQKYSIIKWICTIAGMFGILCLTQWIFKGISEVEGKKTGETTASAGPSN